MVDYVLMKECDASMVNTVRIRLLSLDSDHKPLYLHIVTRNSHINQGFTVQAEKCIMQHCYREANLYANEFERHVMNLSLGKDVKTNWKQLKDLILKVGYQYFSACINEFVCLVSYVSLVR